MMVDRDGDGARDMSKTDKRTAQPSTASSVPDTSALMSRAMGDLCISLIVAGLDMQPLDDERLPKKIEWTTLYGIVASHGVEALAWEGLPRSVRMAIPPTVVAKWQNAAELTLFRQLSYDAEREVVLEDFRKAGLSWLPLKGIRTVTYYPRPGLRSMGDQDLVFGFVDRDDTGMWAFRGATDEERRMWADKAGTIATDIMERHGYRKINDWERELSFAKNGLQFEFHRTIVSHSERSLGYYGDEVLDYYANPWRKAIRDDSGSGGEGRGFHWKPEDEYLFHVSHMMKHAQASGFGLRFLADEVVFYRRFGAIFDWNYIHGELEALGATQFEQSIRALSLTIFDNPEDWMNHVNAGQRSALNEIIANGTYGTRRNALRNSFRRETGDEHQGTSGMFNRLRRNLRHVWHRIYPSIEWVKLTYPAWANSRWKRAVLPLYRLWRGLRRHPADLVYELKLLVGGRESK